MAHVEPIWPEIIPVSSLNWGQIRPMSSSFQVTHPGIIECKSEIIVSHVSRGILENLNVNDLIPYSLCMIFRTDFFHNYIKRNKIIAIDE